MKEKGLVYTCTLDVQHPYILCDTTKVKEIFLNILSNSVKYTPAGGSISLTLTEIPCEKEGCAAYTAVFRDNGIGMSAEYLPISLKSSPANTPPPRARWWVRVWACPSSSPL